MGSINLYLPNDSQMGIGGGWTFRDNLIKGLSRFDDVHIVDELSDANIALISGATMITRDTFVQIKDAGIPIVLRLDGIPEEWRNRGTGFSRLKDFYKESDFIVCQSSFVMGTVLRWLERANGEPGKPSVRIYNGADTDIFNPDGNRIIYGPDFDRSILSVISRKDPNKRFEEVVERFRYYKLDHPEGFLTIVGNVPTEMSQYDFGLYGMKKGKDYHYQGQVTDPQTMAALMRGHKYLAWPSFADPCPNVLIEALQCGMTPVWWNDYGSTPEITHYWELRNDPVKFFSIDLMAKKYRHVFRQLTEYKKNVTL